MEKQKVALTGVPETMLYPVYARYLESKRKHPHFHDTTAIKVVEAMDYNFERMTKNKMNMWGCAARTTILDTQTIAYIQAHPHATIINVACGLDDRFRRVDNGTIQWYNLDFADVITLRDGIIPSHERVVNIAGSALDFSWVEQIGNKDEVLVIAEGILMYFDQEEVRALFDSIATAFEHVTVLCELMTTWMVDNPKIHDVTQTTTAVFKWGVKVSNDFVTLCPAYTMAGEYSMTKGMKAYAPIFITLISSVLTPRNNRIAKFEKSL